MKTGPRYWHIVLLGLAAAILNEVTNLLIKGIENSTTHFIVEAIKFVVIIVVLAILYYKLYLERRKNDEDNDDI
ncbi:hypothetical protein [Enterococcus timonensis]|uniref:hypothetical protein n=1 Tax=Enterococcus timonensis TaxID=1852364 RepID=UPI0008D92139|nr:hypothetical protein [Enterococcus timonensis]